MMTNTELLARSATDEDFRRALIADPKAVLAAEGLTLPPESTVQIEECAADELVFVLPPALPEGTELDDDALAAVSGGATPLVAVMATAALLGAAGGAAGGYALVRRRS